MRILCVASAALVLTAIPARADISVVISKSSQQMAVSVDGSAPMVWTVSTGRAGYNTPSGSFRAIRLEEVYYSKKYDDAPMPNSVFFYGGYAIHGTLEERRLGNPVSHGCVRLARHNAAQLFALVRAHGISRTRIEITDAPLRGYGVPMARGYDGGYGRTLAARSVPERYDARYADPRWRDNGFQQFGGRDWREAPRGYQQPRYVEPQPRMEWREAKPRYEWREPDVRPRAPAPGRTYTEAEYRRLKRQEGWR